MSNSISINEFSRFAAGKKMNFSQTCNLLSQFVKDNKRTNLNLDSSHAAEVVFNNRSTMNLFPVNQAEDSIGRTIDLFPQISGFDSSVNKRASPEPAVAQMTIFYGGKVVVFNDMPSDKAKEVMNLASSFESSIKKRKVEAPTSSVPAPAPAPNAQSQSQGLAMGDPNFVSSVIPPPSPLRQASISTDLPITRKASLQRFLEKRKDRLVGKVTPSESVLGGGAAKAVEGKAWLGLNSLPVFQQKQQQ